LIAWCPQQTDRPLTHWPAPTRLATSSATSELALLGLGLLVAGAEPTAVGRRSCRRELSINWELWLHTEHSPQLINGQMALPSSGLEVVY
jgi:hypothetical protein